MGIFTCERQTDKTCSGNDSESDSRQKIAGKYKERKRILSFLFFRLDNAAIGLFWLLFGNAEEDDIVVYDRAFALISESGRGFLIAYAVCTNIVALNMLIAMMNNSFERVMVSVFYN